MDKRDLPSTGYLLPARNLKTALVCASKETTRYYLNGVALDEGLDGRPIAVGLDGHCGVACAGGIRRGDKPEGLPILPRTILEPALKTITAKDWRGSPFVHAVIDGLAVTLTVYAPEKIDFAPEFDNLAKVTQRGIFRGALVDATYPDWRRVWVQPSGQSPAVAPAWSRLVIERLCTIAGLLGHVQFRLHQADAGGPAAVTWDGDLAGDVLGVAMPCRYGDARAFSWLFKGE